MGAKTVECAYTDEDENLELMFEVSFWLSPPEPRTWEDPGSPGGIEDVEFHLMSIATIDETGNVGRHTDRRVLKDESIAAWERQMLARYHDIPFERERVEAVICASLEN